MKFVNKPFKDGAEAWNDYVMSYGIDEALLICNNYLDLNLKREHAEDERNFTREIFQSMYETALAKAPIKILYPYPFEQAEQFWETYYYNLNCKLNLECSIDIGVAIKESCYLSNFYNLENAAWKVLLKYGFNRVNAVLAHQIQVQEYDGRYSAENKNWAENFILIPATFAGAFVDTHVTLIDGIANHVRKLYNDMAAERYVLPGKEVSGEFTKGYEIKRTIMVDENEGYAIGHNPNAVEPYVCWQFRLRDHKKNYNWGVYGSEKETVDSFNARLFTYAAEKYRRNNKISLAWAGK